MPKKLILLPVLLFMCTIFFFQNINSHAAELDTPYVEDCPDSNNMANGSTSVDSEYGIPYDVAWTKSMGINPKGKCYVASQFDFQIMSDVISIDEGDLYFYSSKFSGSNGRKPRARCAYFDGETYLGQSEVFQYGPTSSPVEIPLIPEASSFRLILETNKAFYDQTIELVTIYYLPQHICTPSDWCYNDDFSVRYKYCSDPSCNLLLETEYLVDVSASNLTISGLNDSHYYPDGSQVTISAYNEGCNVVWDNGDVSSTTITISGAPVSISAYGMLNAESILNTITVGWNLGNSLDCQKGIAMENADANYTTQETAWGNPVVSKELIDYVSSLGFNAIRIPVSWSYECGRDDNGNLVIGEKWLARVREVVDYAIANDMYVILNSHHDGDLIYVGVSSSEFDKVKADASSLWSQIASAFKDYDSHLLFESYNEVPNRGYDANGIPCHTWPYYTENGEVNPKRDVTRWTISGAEQLNELNSVFSKAVRSTGGNNLARTLVLGSFFNGASDIIMSNFGIPDDLTNAYIYDAHVYNFLQDQLTDIALSSCINFTIRTGVPVILGECGVTYSTNSLSSTYYRPLSAMNLVSRAESHGIKIFWWDNGKLNSAKDGYGIIDRGDFHNSCTEVVEGLLRGLSHQGYINNTAVTLSDCSNWKQQTFNFDQNDFIPKTTWSNFVSDYIALPVGTDYVN